MKRQIAIGILFLLCGTVSAQSTPRPRLGFEPVNTTAPTDYMPKTGNGVSAGIKSTEPTPLKPNPTPVLTDISSASDSIIPMWVRLSNRIDGGDGVGYRRGFSTLEAMIPLMESPSSLLFSNLRIVNFLHKERWEYNLGGGYRWYSPKCDVVFGVNSYYDMRKTDFHFYQQAGIGVEALTPWLEFRANGYFIVGPAHRVVGDTGFVNTGNIVNNNFVLNRTQQTEIALTGGEVEVGGRLPFLDRFAPKAYLGYYTYSAEGIAVTHGVRSRLEAQLCDRVSLHFQVQHDYLFQTTVTGGLAFHFGAPVYRTGNRGSSTWTDVLRQGVHRDVNIVIINGATNSTGTQPAPKEPDPS